MDYFINSKSIFEQDIIINEGFNPFLTLVQADNYNKSIIESAIRNKLFDSETLAIESLEIYQKESNKTMVFELYNWLSYICASSSSVLNEDSELLDKSIDYLKSALKIKPDSFETNNRLLDLFKLKRNKKLILEFLDLI